MFLHFCCQVFTVVASPTPIQTALYYMGRLSVSPAIGSQAVFGFMVETGANGSEWSLSALCSPPSQAGFCTL